MEPLGGYILLAYLTCSKIKINYGSAWNFGPNKSSCLPVRDVLMEFKKYKNQLKFNMPKKFVHEAKYLSLNVKKAKNFKMET